MEVLGEVLRNDVQRSGRKPAFIGVGDGAGLPKPVVLQPADAADRACDGGPVNNLRRNTCFPCPDTQVRVGCRDHRIAAAEHHGGPAFCSLQNCFRVLFNVFAVQEDNIFAVEFTHLLYCNPGQPGGIIFQKNRICGLHCCQSLD